MRRLLAGSGRSVLVGSIVAALACGIVAACRNSDGTVRRVGEEETRETGKSVATPVEQTPPRKPDDPPPVPPKPSSPSDAEIAIERFSTPPDLEVSLVAAEPDIANPVAFTIDERGRFYVVETFRLFAGVTDTRRNMYWLDDDLACRTVEDRVAMYRKYAKDDFEKTYATAEDRVRRLVDTDGDGRVDQSTVLAGGFTDASVGIGAGVLTRGDKVWFACIPDLWLLEDSNDDGVADEKTSLHRGYGVHVGYLGHDLHGLIFGPDGKLYFSIGDRGLHVKTKEGVLRAPDVGTVLRCEPDGSELEIFATGLRNPQELAFDDYGNLFTCDNNSDGGDQARWVYLVEGGDSGWRIGYQFIASPVARGPWNAEKLWQPWFEGQAAYILPPSRNFADGPSGLVYQPGTSLDERYRGRFFLADFRGASAKSGIRTLALEPAGASFDIASDERFVWNVLATDVEFGYDGALYFSDWIEGWDMPGRGRLYRVSSKRGRRELWKGESVESLIGKGLSKKWLGDLAELLAHSDRRVRQSARHELLERATRDGEATAVLELLEGVVKGQGSEISRVEGLWALGRLGRTDSRALEIVLRFATEHAKDELLAQSLRVLGDAKHAPAFDVAVKGLGVSDHPRTQFFAAMLVGKLGSGANRSALPQVLELVESIEESDVYLRHAAALALAGGADPVTIADLAGHASPRVRLAAVLALRRHESSRIETFLADANLGIVAEAARALYDVPIEIPTARWLALLADRRVSASIGDAVSPGEVALRRAIAAAQRAGTEACAKAVAEFAARADLPVAIRLDAIDALRHWDSPSVRDRIVGLWRPVEPRDAGIAGSAIGPVFASLLGDESPELRLRSAQLASEMGLTAFASALFDVVRREGERGDIRAAALDSLGSLRDASLPTAIRNAIESNEPLLRARGRLLLAAEEPEAAMAGLREALRDGTSIEKQSALLALGRIPGAGADAEILRWLGRLESGYVAEDLALDLLDAAEKRTDARVVQALRAYETTRAEGDVTERYSECRSGGNAERGKKLFLSKAEISCQRCHRIGELGGDVGPDLSKIGAQRSREEILRSIVDPDAQSSEGFETVVLVLTDGRVVTGISRASENADELLIVDSEGKPTRVKKSLIAQRSTGVSAMPDNVVYHLSKREIRDLVEYLARRK